MINTLTPNPLAPNTERVAFACLVIYLSHLDMCFTTFDTPGLTISQYSHGPDIDTIVAALNL